MACIAPRAENEDAKRHEFILNTILCCIIPFLVILDAIVAIYSVRQGSHYDGISLLTFSSIVLVSMYLLMLSRSGYHKAATYIFLAAYFLAITYGAVRWGVELPLVAISYIMIIVISSILISTRFAFLIAGIISATVTWVTYLQIQGVLHPILHWKRASIRTSDAIELSIIFFLVTGISWLSNREIERSLKRARASERSLLEERDLLEIKVEERTKELKEIQKDKISQLYRFAEFGKLSSGIFHDLMNTLNVVVVNATRLESSADHLPEFQAYLNKSVAASKRIGTYIDSVRKQIADNDSHSAFSWEKEINDALDILHFRAREASVTFNLDIKDEVVMHGNAIKFYQVILNLLSNAVDACEENVRESVIDIIVERSDQENALLTIRDNGSGIPATIIETIFNQFFTTKSYAKGMGLGLSQTKEIVEKEFHGSIAVRSIENEGTTFIISFPLINQDATETLDHTEADSEDMQ
jgi:C4-dicarboxylate-specific signal transduction histidine kinase